MAFACMQVDGKWMMEEVSKEYQLPMELLREKTYQLQAKYGDEQVLVSSLDSSGYRLCPDVNLVKNGRGVTFNQFFKFMKERMQLPDLFSLVVTVPSEGIVSCEVGIFPQKRVY